MKGKCLREKFQTKRGMKLKHNIYINDISLYLNFTACLLLSLLLPLVFIYFNSRKSFVLLAIFRLNFIELFL